MMNHEYQLLCSCWERWESEFVLCVSFKIDFCKWLIIIGGFSDLSTCDLSFKILISFALTMTTISTWQMIIFVKLFGLNNSLLRFSSTMCAFVEPTKSFDALNIIANINCVTGLIPKIEPKNQPTEMHERDRIKSIILFEFCAFQWIFNL